MLCIYYRGPKGVWTLEKEGKKPEVNLDFNDAKPTVTHMAIKSLIKHGLILELPIVLGIILFLNNYP